MEEIVGITEVAAALNDGPLIIRHGRVVDDVLDLGQWIATYIAERRIHPDSLRAVRRYLAADHLDRLVGLTQVMVTIGAQETIVMHRRYTYPQTYK